MSVNISNKKTLAEKIKSELNSPNYVAMPDLITHDDYHGGIGVFKLGGKKGQIFDMRSKEQRQKGDLGKVYQNQLEPSDWEEIVNLIEKRNEEKEQIWETKKKNIEQKLNSQSNLYYYWGKGELWKNERADGWHSDKGMRGFATFLGGNGNGLTHHLYIAEEHPVLDSFSFQTGFYLIDNDKSVEKNVGHYEGGFGCSGGETNSNNWQKFVEASDQITITPCQMVDKTVEKPSRSDKPSKSINFGGNKSDNSLQSPTNSPNLEKDLTKLLLQYFQENNIKLIKLDNNELEITYNEGQLVKKPNNSQELQKVSEYFSKTNKQELTREELSRLNSTVNTNNNSQEPKNNHALLIIGGVGILTVGLIVGLLISRRNKKSK